ncbi:hypothetical protein BU14_0216s0025 [Porphyra umbilicalis]|uniref:Uncharacterized protein n=1 Tax=Porphyra umbilicalis TaxID=2786 RepID=A0A1X6P512_PORUM|nr:hypothetical protein BU14_0216s0025 [Porphyra umbilicalis]|eukprot:OSX75934.1 hypothetical protein BU14_0216s0025 [Porphyra umbilicalis]
MAHSVVGAPIPVHSWHACGGGLAGWGGLPARARGRAKAMLRPVGRAPLAAPVWGGNASRGGGWIPPPRPDARVPQRPLAGRGFMWEGRGDGGDDGRRARAAALWRREGNVTRGCPPLGTAAGCPRPPPLPRRSRGWWDAALPRPPRRLCRCARRRRLRLTPVSLPGTPTVGGTRVAAAA